MLKLLLPIEISERSKQSIDWVKQKYDRKDVSIILLSISEDFDALRSEQEYLNIKEERLMHLRECAANLSGFDVEMRVSFGFSGEEIIKAANDLQVNAIIMTKSAKDGLIRMIGSVTTHVIKYAKCAVIIVPEA